MTGNSQDPRERRSEHAALLRRALSLGAGIGLVALVTWPATALRLPWGPLADLAVGLALGLALLGLGTALLGLLRWIGAPGCGCWVPRS